MATSGWWSIALILAMGVVFTAWAASATQRDDELRALQAFSGHVQRLEQDIIRRIGRVDYGLRAIRGAMLNSPDVSRAEFRSIIESQDLTHEFVGVSGFLYIERVWRSEPVTSTDLRRSDGSAPDTELLVVRHTEPAAPHTGLLGLDLSHDPVLREALDEAAARGRSTLSGRVTLVQDGTRNPGLVYFLPVYRAKVGAAQGQEPLGFVGAPLVMAKMFENLPSFVDFSLDLRLYEGAAADGRLLFDTRAAVDAARLVPATGADEKSLLRQELQFSIGGRLFTLKAAGRPVLEERIAGWQRPAVIVAVSGAFLTLLLAFAAALMVRGQARTEAVVRRRTAELRQASAALANSNERLQATMTELQTARDKALRASRAKSQFVANMSHELRTPMNAILGMLQLVRHTPLNEKQQDYLAKAEGAATALLAVLNDVLDFSKIEAGKLVFDPREFEVDTMLQDMSILFATAVAGKPVEFVYDLAPGVPRRLMGDDLRLRQVLVNLGSNAAKFTERGQVVLAIRAADVGPGSVTLEFSVADTGIGIAPENLKHLFQDFGQAEASTTRRFGGTGLGLAICRKLVALMGGELRVDSTLGRGSRFSFQLVLPTVHEQVATARPAATSSPAGGRRRALVVDASELTAGAHVRMLQGEGWDAVVAASAQEAEALMASSPHAFDALLVDWKVDGKVPLAAARRLGSRLQHAGLPLVVHGPSEVNELLAQLEPERQARITACLTRPVTPGMLARALGKPAGAADMPSKAQVPDNALHGLRLLVAEDNENNQLVARELLGREGAEVVIACDGIEAVDQIRSGGRFDAVLMDCQMPRMDGLQACAAIRAMGMDRIPIIAMTANAMASDRDECLAAGMDDHVAKPFVLKDLVRVILSHVAAQGPAREATDAEPGRAAQAADAHVPPPPPERPVLDRTTAIQQLGGDAGLYEQLLPMFRQELSRTLSFVRTGLQAGADPAEARRRMHTLKGTAGTVGALYLADRAHRAEQAIAGGERAGEWVEGLEHAATRTLEALDA